MKNDVINVTITEEGVCKLETDKISIANHALADNLVKAIAEVAGGKTTRTAKHKHAHTTHSHEHHEGEQHSH